MMTMHFIVSIVEKSCDFFLPLHEFTRILQMIAYIKGKLVAKTPTYVILETTGGVAYHIAVSLHTYGQMGTAIDAKLYTYFHVKEDIQALFGFAEESERELFTHLISVSGIGPATAQMMLSSLNPQEIIEAILAENISVLKGTKGVGPKTAKRIVLELKDKMSKKGGAIMSAGSGIDHAIRDEGVQALVGLGINKPIAQKAIDKVLKNNKSVRTLEQLIKEALKNI